MIRKVAFFEGKKVTINCRISRCLTLELELELELLGYDVTSLYNVIGNNENILGQTFIIYNLAPELF